jgi:phage tail-like protein
MTSSRGDAGYRYVNLERRWPSCTFVAVEADAGVLRLASVPSRATSVRIETGDASALAGPSRIGVASDGAVYVADPAGHRVLRVDPCDGTAVPLACLAGPGGELGELREPHGVAVGPHDTLYVADTGNARVQLVDRRTGQVRGALGAARPWDPAERSDDEGRLRAPWDVAVDGGGNLYVAEPATTDAGGHRHPGRVQKFDRRGRLDGSFWATMRAQPTPPASPVSIVVVHASEGGEALLVLDGSPARALVFSLDGTADAAATAAWAAFGQRVTAPASAAAGGDMIYVADATSSQLLVFTSRGAFVGVARDYSADTIGLAVDGEGRLLAQPRAGGSLAHFTSGESYAELGTVVAGPFEHEPGERRWFRVHVDADLPAGTHLQLFTFTSDEVPRDGPPAPVLADGSPTDAMDDAASRAPTPKGRWRAAPPGASQALVLNQPARHLWIALALHGGGAQTPLVRQVRLDDDESGWLEHLPALYRRDEPTRAFLERALALFQDELDGVETRLEELVSGLDPRAAPDDRAAGSWLEWLAGWLAFPLAESWTTAQRRGALAKAFGLEAGRGTAESLRALVRLYAGAWVRVTEPALTQSLWALGSDARLGVETMLAPASPYGAVLDTSAALDRSHLLDAADKGAPAFAAVANRFCVEAYAADFPGEAARRELARVIDAEKPAHTVYHLSFIEPAMRVGAQARVGIDTIVAGTPGLCLEPGGLALDDRATLTDPAARPPRAAVGRTARLGGRAVVS